MTEPKNRSEDRSLRSLSAAGPASWEPPQFEVLALDCEITAYAPDGDDPLF
jgi:hypothetical protein